MTPDRRAVFLDRDGTIIRDADYLTEVHELELLPGAARAMQRLREAGYLLIVVTNQSAVARGWLTEEKLQGIHAALDAMLEPEGAAPDAYYYCPHLPDGPVAEYGVECHCRKPAPGMLRRAAAEWSVDPEQSFMVGDSARDVQAGRAVGCFSIMLGPGDCPEADARADDLAGAARIILDRDTALPL
jgi:D-glycero-D-manno-heptose 1,7-bisphosphate phosphatase